MRRPDLLNCLHFFLHLTSVLSKRAYSPSRRGIPLYRTSQKPLQHPAEEHVGVCVCVWDGWCVCVCVCVWVCVAHRLCVAGCCVISGRLLAVLVVLSADDQNILFLSLWWWRSFCKRCFVSESMELLIIWLIWSLSTFLFSFGFFFFLYRWKLDSLLIIIKSARFLFCCLVC